jgi:serine/threonine-protein kinase
MQKYGMYHADGGNIALTAQSDRNTTAKWAGLLGASDLAALKVEDFEVVQHSSALAFGYNCVRTP